MKKDINIGTEFNIENIEESDLLRHLQKGVLENIKDNPFAAKSDNRKTEKFNVELHNNDIVILEYFAKKLGVTRSKILTQYLTELTEDLWRSLSYRDMSELAKGIDGFISEHGLMHKYKGETWKLELSRLSVTEAEIEASYGRDETIFGENK